MNLLIILKKIKISSSIKIKIPDQIKFLNLKNLNEELKSNIDLIVLGISSKGIEWVSDQLSQIYKNKNVPKY